MATTIMPRMRDGKASSTSITCMAKASRRPPYRPATMPISEPTTIATTVEASPISSDSRAP